MNIIPFPGKNRVVVADAPKKQKPNTVEVQFDFGRWTLAYFHDRRFKSRLPLDSKAEAEARRLLKTGMTWRCGPNDEVYLFPDSTDGGCWAVAHNSRYGDSDALLSRHFSLDDAINEAVWQAQTNGAAINAGINSSDGGIAR